MEKERRSVFELTEREKQIDQLREQGLSLKQIAESLGLKPRTIKRYQEIIDEKKRTVKSAR